MKSRLVLATAVCAALLASACASATTDAPRRQPGPPAGSTERAPETGEQTALMRGVRLSGSEIVVVVDYAEVLRGAEASAAAAQHDPLFAGKRSYLVVNDEKESVSLPVAESARFRWLDPAADRLRVGGPSEFLEAWMAAGDGDAIRQDPYVISIAGGSVADATQTPLR